MPNSQFTSAEREDADTLVRINVTVKQESGFVAQVDQVIDEKSPSGFEVLARRTAGPEVDPSLLLEVVGLLTCRVEGKDEEEISHWVDHLEAEPASGASSTAGWRQRDQA